MQRHSRTTKSFTFIEPASKQQVSKVQLKSLTVTNKSYDGKRDLKDFIDIDRLNLLRSRQGYMAKQDHSLPPLNHSLCTSNLNASGSMLKFENLLDEIEAVDLKYLRLKLENSGRRFHFKIKQLNLKSGGLAAERRALKMISWGSLSQSSFSTHPSKLKLKGRKTRIARDKLFNIY